MKIKLLFVSAICCSITAAFGQLKSPRTQANVEITNIERSTELLRNTPKTLLCQDTIRYSYAKEAILGTPTFYYFALWSGDLEYISHTFLNSSSIQIAGAEFQGRRSTSSGSNPNVEVSIYSVDGSNNPLTQLTSATVVISATTGIYQVTFPSAITVTGNYAIVVRPTTGVMDIIINDDVVSSYDENLAKYKSNYYASSGNSWIPVSGFTEYVTASGYPVDFEPIVAPRISYTIDADFSLSSASVCQGTPVTYTNITTPTGVLGNRMTNYSAFLTHFGIATSDSTYVYDMDNGSPYIWNGVTSYTHPTAGTYDVFMGVNGGFWESCFDFKEHTVTVNPLPLITQGTLTSPSTCGSATGSIQVNGTGTGDVSWTGTASGNANGVTLPYTIPTLAAGSYNITFTSGGCTSTVLTSNLSDPTPPATPTISVTGALSFCAGGSVLLTSSEASGNVWSANTGSATTQGVTVTSSGIYTVTYTNAGCSATSAPVTVTVNPLPAAPTISTGGPTTFCSGGSVTLTSSQATGNVWSANAGSATTQAVTATTSGSYTVTYTDGNGCSGTSIPTILTVNPSPATPTISVTGALTFCAGGSVVLTSSEATGNTWSANAGSATTQAVTATTSGSYTVTYADGSGCSATSAPVAVTVNALPTVTLSALGTVCVYDPSMTLTGGLPTGGTYSGTGVGAGSFDPATAGNGTHTITYTYEDVNNCSNTATEDIIVDGCLSIGESDLTNVKVYPNPTQLNLTIEVSGDFNYEILDTKGRVIANGNGNNTVVVNTADFTSGVYFVSLKSETMNTTTRVVKN